MKEFIRKLYVLPLLASVKANFNKRDPYWIKMSDIIQQVRPDFQYGVSTTRDFFKSKRYQDIISTYTLQVPGNECKFYTIEKSGDFDLSQCNEAITFAKSFNAKVRGHTLFWPANSPDWFTNYSDDIEVTKQYIMNYITKVLDYYKDEESIIYWDVINEAVTDKSNSTTTVLKYGNGNSHEFVGWDTYSEDIYALAREHTNPNVKLCYNDYNAENNNGNIEGKTGAVFNYVKSLKEKELIDCVGFQMHVSGNYYPNYEQLTQIITMYEEIGVEVHITEIDVSMKYCESYEQQLEIYNGIFQACFDHPNCKVFTVWGARDAESWIGAENEPLPFDNDMYPKNIYYDMLDYVMEKLPPSATYPIPTVTTKPTPDASVDVPNALYLIKPGSYMISPYWSNWSWDCSTSLDDEGNVIVEYIKLNGSFSLFNMNGFNGGTLHLEIKVDQPNIKFKVDTQIVNANKSQLIAFLEDIPTDKMLAYDLKIPSIEGGYNRISIRSIESENAILTINNYYFKQLLLLPFQLFELITISSYNCINHILN
ncbi:glycoside hydrolase family 10 protein [Piromyces sp. E2]|nr:glycoside hydrolase family 10 protein [Piromyces sp. E2]|eukprot:OUM60122.1 glycoside hydrolase family 10 protein [Piromyces sp. E2]